MHAALLPELSAGLYLPGDEKYEINQEQCVQCGTCYELCPISAIEKREK